MKIQIFDGCGSSNFTWQFPGTVAELLVCWKKVEIPCLSHNSAYRGKLEECDYDWDNCDAVIMHHNHNLNEDESDHVHILQVDGQEYRLQEDEVYRIINKEV